MLMLGRTLTYQFLTKISMLNNDDLDFSIDDNNSSSPDKSTTDELSSKVEILKKKLEKQASGNICKNSLSIAFMITRKITRHMHVIGIAVSLTELLMEIESDKKLDQLIDVRIHKAKNELEDDILKLRLTDLKTKFLAIKNTFEIIVNGIDDFDIRQSRLGAVLGICEEISIMISSEKSDFYANAHLCIDLVYLFLVLHLSMLDMAVNSFNMNDFSFKYNKLIQYYEVLMNSYIEQAMSNYIKPVILDYHNQYSSFNEYEEIYYELTKTVVYKLENNGLHKCWSNNIKSLEKDKIYYHFKQEKLQKIEPALLIGAESPVLMRAIRYGVCLKLEEMFAQYQNIGSLFKREAQDVLRVIKDENLNKSESFKSEDSFNDLELKFEENKEPQEEEKQINKENNIPSQKSSLERSSDFKDALGFTITQIKEKEFASKYSMIDEEEFHFCRTKDVHLSKLMAETIKGQAKREQHLLCDLYEIKKKEFDEHPTTSEKFIVFFNHEIKDLISNNHEVFSNISKYVIFSEENQRFFKTEL